MPASRGKEQNRKTGIWVTVTDSRTGRKKSKRLPDGYGLSFGRGQDGTYRQTVLPPQPIRELPPKKAPKRKAG
jgi:hypothetical protein